jgi:hypothetical protein
MKLKDRAHRFDPEESDLAAFGRTERLSHLSDRLPTLAPKSLRCTCVPSYPRRGQETIVSNLVEAGKDHVQRGNLGEFGNPL